MKRFFVTLLACVMLFAVMAVGISAETLDSILLRNSSADPWLFTDGNFYYLTMTGATKVGVLRAKDLNSLSTMSVNNNIVYNSASDPTVQELFGAGAKLSGTWSPEIHYFTEEEAPGNSGWYMFLAIRNSTGDSSEVQMVVLKSTNGNPNGPYGHPVTGARNHSQPVLNADGTRYTPWGVGMSTLTIAEGPYKGIYTTWVTEVGRGGSGVKGEFYQQLMIAKMENPWTIASEAGVITTPTQKWEFAGSSETHPRVVEGATAVYGAHGEIFITYAGSGYWSDYGIGQITWTGGDPLKTESWVKLPDRPGNGITTYNPVFQSKKAADMRGAGHPSFITDKDGNGFLCYHAYPIVNGKRAESRNAYLEPYYIDYTEWNGTSYGVIHPGLADNGIPASKFAKVTFATEGEALGETTVTAASGDAITLTMASANATGYSIFRSTDGTTFNYLATVAETTYTDTDVADGNTYYYRVYSYRNEEIGQPSAVVSAIGGTAPATTPAVTEAPIPAESTGMSTGVLVAILAAIVAAGAAVIVVVLKKK